MKTVRSLAHATKTAAQMGAPLEVGGRVINSSGAKLSVVKPEPKAEPAPAPAPTPAPAPDTSTLDALSHMIVLQAESQRQTMIQMLDRLQAPPAPVAVPMRPVRFLVIRDSDAKPIALVPTYGPGRATTPTFEVRKGKDGFATEIVPVYRA